MSLKETIKRVLREELSRKEILRNYAKENGLEIAFKIVGGPENYIKMAYDGDKEEYYKNENFRPYFIKKGLQEINMYIDDVIVKYLNLEDETLDRKELGEFFYGSGYKVDAVLIPYRENKWKVAAMGGTRGFGYSYINKRDELGNKFRQQIFQQIIDKYNLDNY